MLLGSTKQFYLGRFRSKFILCTDKCTLQLLAAVCALSTSVSSAAVGLLSVYDKRSHYLHTYTIYTCVLLLCC